MKLILEDGSALDIEDFTFDSRTGFLTVIGIGEDIPWPEEPEQPEPEPEIPEYVTLKYPIDLFNGESNKKIIIPAKDTISSKFTAPETGKYGSIKFEPEAAHGYPSTTYWISETPGGVALPNSENTAAGITFGVDWIVGRVYRKKVVLVAGNTYYLNMQHDPKRAASSVVYRFVR